MYAERQNKEATPRQIQAGGRQRVKINFYDGKKSNLHASLMVQKMGRMATRSQDPGHRPASIPAGYRRYSGNRHVWEKDVSDSKVLMWDNPLRTAAVHTGGNREEDKRGLPTQSGYVWHHCELDFSSGTGCLMQLVPSYEHQSISHIGAIEQYSRWP